MKPTVKALLNVRVPMQDGVGLATHVYLPDTVGAFPVLFMRTPYEAMGKGAGVLDWPEAGYAYVTQDVRGRYLSEGEFYPWVHEPADGADALEWIAAQPWCNGNIVMYGGSYVGATQIGCALSGHPALKCITPALIGADWYHTSYWGGAFRLKNQSSWVLAPGENVDRDALQWHLPLSTLDMEAAGREVPYWRDALAHPQRDEFWQTVPADFGAIKTPAFLRTGWFDLFIADTFELFNGIRLGGGSEAARNGTRMVVGPWPHNINQRVVGEVDFGEASVIGDLFEQEKAYLAHYAGLETAHAEEAAPLKVFVMGTNEWRDEWEWPLKRTVWTDFYLSSGGKANTKEGDGRLGAMAGDGSDEFEYDPANPVPTLGGAWEFVNVGPMDQREIEQRPDVLTYTSEVLEQDVEVTGPVEVRLFASSSALDTDFTAKLVDVHPDGRAMSVTDGIVRGRYRNGSGQAALLIPDEVYEFRISCCPTSMVFLRGHRIRLEISSSNFPAFARNLNTGEISATGTRMETARQTIYFGLQHPSRLMLPVIPAD